MIVLFDALDKEEVGYNTQIMKHSNESYPKYHSKHYVHKQISVPCSTDANTADDARSQSTQKLQFIIHICHFLVQLTDNDAYDDTSNLCRRVDVSSCEFIKLFAKREEEMCER